MRKDNQHILLAVYLTIDELRALEKHFPAGCLLLADKVKPERISNLEYWKSLGALIAHGFYQKVGKPSDILQD